VLLVSKKVMRNENIANEDAIAVEVTPV